MTAIKAGEYVVVQRQNVVQIFALKGNMECRLGRDIVDLSNIVGEKFWTSFKMIPKINSKKKFTVEKCDNLPDLSDTILSSTLSGVDNRNINDDGGSQKLSIDDIENMKDQGASALTIMESLVENSKTFSSKTGFSQEKYLKKKVNKYSEYIVIKKPTLRIVAERILGNWKALGLRMDTLAQLTTIASIRSGGTYMVFESGCQGLITAAVLNAMGSTGTILNIHSGHVHEKHILSYLNYSQERQEQILTLNIFHLLQSSSSSGSVKINTAEHGKRKNEENSEEPVKKKSRWMEREEMALEIIKEKPIDALLVVATEHPANITKSLLRYLHPARPFVIYSSAREILQELFLELKARSDVTALRLTESWLRTYQVLPERTHPDISMSGSGGFLLSGFKVSC